MDYSRYPNILTERRGRIRRVRMNQPDVLKAVDAGLHCDLSMIFKNIRHDPETDAVALTGANGAYQPRRRNARKLLMP